MSRKLFPAALWLLSVVGLGALPGALPAVAATYFLNEGPTLPSPASTISQSGISKDPLTYVRLAGEQVFSTQFRSNVVCYVPPNQTMATPISDGDPPIDGFGDGCNENLQDPTRHSGAAGRPYLQDNGTFLRVNGLGSQSCLECHDQASSRAIPFTMGVGGHGGLNSTEIVFASEAASEMNGAPAIINLDDRGLPGDPRGYAKFNGRIINPPDTFGDGGVQLVAEEMTAQLQTERNNAITEAEAEGTSITAALSYRSQPPSDAQVTFGYITCHKDGSCDTSQVQGVNSDLVVRPFGRKGEFDTVRAFADNAFEFHSGMQPEEVDPNDPDQDGVSNEVTIGQMSALSVFLVSESTPFQEPIIPNSPADMGRTLFKEIGCASCHIPELDTATTDLELTLPSQPLATSSPPFSQSGQPPYYKVDLTQAPASFSTNGHGGIRVEMYSDLKRHNMGQKLCESAAFNDRAPELPAEGAITGGKDQSTFNCEFITAKLWGVFDSAPYLHDGRALILSTAILLHGGDAATAESNFAKLTRAQQNEILAFLATLRNPVDPNSDVVP